MSLIPEADQDRFDEVRRNWHPDLHGDREDSYAMLVEEWREVEWRSGGRTLLVALGLQFNEVKLCRGLAWLLDPEGGHDMGDHALHALLRDLEVPAVQGSPVTIGVEESQGNSRADIVVRIGGHTVVIEAKVYAGEQPKQADRISRHWSGDSSTTLVFLTRNGSMPTTAQQSGSAWVPRTWRSVAGLLRTCADEANLDPSYGAREFIQTIGAL